MNGKDDTSTPPQPSTQQMFSIGDIFKNITRKIKDTKTQNSDTSVFASNPAQVSEPCGDISDATSEQSNSISFELVTSSELENQRSCNDIPVTSAPVSVLDPRNNDISLETSISGLLPEDRVASAPVETSGAGSEVYTGEFLQAKSPTGNSEQASAENDTPQEQQNDVVHIKQEKEDIGYDLHQHGSNSTDVTIEPGRIKIEPFRPGVKMESGENPELGSDPDVIFHGVSYRDPDDCGSESDSGTSVSSFEMEAEPEVSEVVVPRSKGEIMPEELPPLENLHISLPEEAKLEVLGVVSGIVGVLVIIESTVDLKFYSPLNDETVLFLENRQPFGVVFEVFGPCVAPSYSVRFNTAADIQEKGMEIGLKIYFVPDPVPEVGEITHYVFIQRLKKMKGSDASWKGNNEPPDEVVEFSDDDEEKRFKAKRKAERKNKNGTAEPKKRATDDGNKGKRGPAKKHASWSVHEGTPSSSVHGGADSRGPARYTNTNGDSQGQLSSSFGSGNRHFSFRNDFRMSKPVFTAPANPMTRPPRHWGPPPPPGSPSPQPFLPRSGAYENGRVGRPFSSSAAHGSFRGDQVRPPFPDGPRGRQSFGAPMRPALSPGSGGRPFGGAPVRSRFPDGGPGSFAGEPVSASMSSNFWRPPNSVSAFPINTSVPPPEFPAFSAGQVNAQQEHPHPPPPWTPSPPQSFGAGYGSASPSPSPSAASSSGVQPSGFGSNPGQVGPPSLGFDAGHQSSARFQGQPQFVQYHHQGHSWQP